MSSNCIPFSSERKSVTLLWLISNLRSYKNNLWKGSLDSWGKSVCYWDPIPNAFHLGEDPSIEIYAMGPFKKINFKITTNKSLTIITKSRKKIHMSSNNYKTCSCILFSVFCFALVTSSYLKDFIILFMVNWKIIQSFLYQGQSKFCCFSSTHMFPVPGHIHITEWPLAMYFYSSHRVHRLSEQWEDSWKTFLYQDSRNNFIIHWGYFNPHMTIWNCQYSNIFDLQKWQFHMAHTNTSH